MAEAVQVVEGDQNLVAILKKGDQYALEILYDKYAPALLGVITRIIGDHEMACKCLQESFFEIWKRKESFDPAKERLFTWMIRITRQIALDICGGSRINVNADTREIINLVNCKDVKNFLLEKFRSEGDKYALSLDENQRKALDLIYFKGYSFEDAAVQLNLSLDILKSSVIKAIKQLKGGVEL